MPELPEVETVRRYLGQHIAGSRIVNVELRRADLRYPIPVDAVRALTGRVIDTTRRRGKYLLIDVHGGAETPGVGAAVALHRTAMLVHLGMSGRLFVDLTVGAPFQKHEHWRMRLVRDGVPADLRYVDARRFGALDVVPAAVESTHKLIAALGVEPLSEVFDGPLLYALSGGRKVAIKQLIMDARKVVGVGNIYAAEALWRARISPHRSAGKLSRAGAVRLVAAIKDVLTEAIAAGGTTLRDFVSGDQRPGYFQQKLDVYGRAGQPCRRCPDTPIMLRMTQGRATTWCARCQR